MNVNWSIHNNDDDFQLPVQRPLSSGQLRRLSMTDEQKKIEKERAHIRYKERRNRMTEEELARDKECARIRAQKRQQNMSEEERSERREYLRLKVRAHRQNKCQQTTFSSRHAQPSNVAYLQTDVPDVVNPITNSEVITHLENHLQSEVDRLGLSAVLPSLNTNMDFISININEARDQQPIPIYDVNFGKDWTFYQVPADTQSYEQGSVSNHLPQENVPRSRGRGHSQKPQHNCARNVLTTRSIKPLHLQSMRTCRHCEARLFPYETEQMCCLHGKIQLPLPTTPPELLHLYTTDSPDGIHFRQNIRAYNHVFAFTSMGVHLDQTLANAESGVYTYRAQGSIYHKIGCLLPQNNERPRYLQMYIYDTDHELENRMAENPLVNREVLAVLKQMLDNCNPFVQVFRHISQRHDRDNIQLHLKESTSNRRQYDLPSSSQVAAILVGGEEPSDRNDRDIIVETRTGRLYNVPDTAGFYDPLQYPLLHPYGHFGWDLNLHHHAPHKISTREYYSYMLQIRHNHDSIFLRAGRLLQQYVVDQYVKISTQNLRYIRDHQATVRAELYQGLQDSVNAGEANSDNVGRKIILPPSYIGSPRDMQRRYYDAMALVSKFGKPDIFLTMTCNPNWDEIQENLLPGQTAQDRPDLATRVFHAKCEELKNDLTKYNVLGKVIAHVHVIEFQKRGLPHAHFLLILDERDKLKSPHDYDQVVCAEIPDPTLEPELHALVLKHMIHGPCGRRMNPFSPCMKNDRCKKKFP